MSSTVAAAAAMAAPAQAVGILPSVAPSTPWLSLDPATTLTRIGIGSCLHQAHPQPIWASVLTAAPQLMLMVGDNVYGDSKGEDLRPLAAAYRKQLAVPEFAAARARLPMLGIWDDHDYGLNDAGDGYRHKAGAATLFRAFWQLPDAAPADRGVYYARAFGPPGRRVQIIALDTRSFRSPLKVKDQSFPHWGKYMPDPDPAKSMLGAHQWSWLAARLAEPAELRIVISSIQVLAEGHGFERWGNLPAERDRLVSLVRSTGAKGVVLASGDRHMGALYAQALGPGRMLPELTASSLNRSYGPSKDARTPELKSAPYHAENFGLIDIDWAARTLTLRLKGLGGEAVADLPLTFAALGHGN